MSVIEGLRRSSKGQLRYDLRWKPTSQELDKCAQSPTISGEFARVIQPLVDGKEEDKAPGDVSEKRSGNDRNRKYNKGQNLLNTFTRVKKEQLGPEHYDITHVDLYKYEQEQKQEAQLKVEARKARFEKHSEQIMKGKKHTLQQLDEDRRNDVLELIQVLKQEVRSKDIEVARKQKDVELQHEIYAARASSKVRHVEELKQKVIQEQEKNKKEVAFLCNADQEVEMKYKELETVIKDCVHKQFLQQNTATILEEAHKVLNLSASTFNDCQQVGKAVDGALQHLPEYCSMMNTLLNKAKAAVNEAEAKAKREIAEKEATKKDEEKKRKEADVKKEREKVKQQEDLAKATAVPQYLSNSISSSSFKEYTRLEKLLEQTEKSYEGLASSKDQAHKRLKLELQRAVTTPINTLSDQSPNHLMIKITLLIKLLKGQQIDLSGKTLSTSVHPQAPVYCSNLLAKKIVQQGSQQVSSNHNAAFPLAAVAIGIWSVFPEVGDLILSHMYKQCPFLVPLYIPQADGMSDVEYFKALGYLCENGEVEPRDKYLKRISGTIRLYAAIVSSTPPKGCSQNHPHGVAHGWMWLSRILNLPPKADYTATAVFEFLDVAGHALARQYRGQFWKLVHALVRDLVPKIDQITAPSQSGPVVRLKNFLEKSFLSRSMEVPEGYLGPSWWNSTGFSGIFGS